MCEQVEVLVWCWVWLGDVICQLSVIGDLQMWFVNVSVYFEVFGYFVVVWLWFDVMFVVYGYDGDFYDGKCVVVCYFFYWELLKVDVQFDLLLSVDMIMFDMCDVWF